MTNKFPKVRKDRAVQKFDGSIPKLAKFLGVTPEAVYQWKGDYVPTTRAYQLVTAFPKIQERE